MWEAGFCTALGDVDLGGNLGCSTDVVHKGSANKVYKVCLLRGAVGGVGKGYGGMSGVGLTPFAHQGAESGDSLEGEPDISSGGKTVSVQARIPPSDSGKSKTLCHSSFSGSYFCTISTMHLLFHE